VTAVNQAVHRIGWGIAAGALSPIHDYVIVDLDGSVDPAHLSCTPFSAVMPAATEVTELLVALSAGDRGAMDRLFPLVYRELQACAHRQLARRSSGETLNTTALVHETYLKLTANDRQTYTDRVHFFAVAAGAMRQILVDYARRAAAGKRGGGMREVSLDLAKVGAAGRADELIALDEALTELAAADARLARTVELRFFGGLSVEETADVLGTSPRTVKRDWRKARAYLYDALRSARGP
jgi:RNA polymerase sigma factor (TIGR02999 family)